MRCARPTPTTWYSPNPAGIIQSNVSSAWRQAFVIQVSPSYQTTTCVLASSCCFTLDNMYVPDSSREPRVHNLCSYLSRSPFPIRTCRDSARDLLASSLEILTILLSFPYREDCRDGQGGSESTISMFMNSPWICETLCNAGQPGAAQYQPTAVVVALAVHWLDQPWSRVLECL